MLLMHTTARVFVDVYRSARVFRDAWPARVIIGRYLEDGRMDVGDDQHGPRLHLAQRFYLTPHSTGSGIN